VTGGVQPIAVSALNEYVKTLLENDDILQNVAVCGEISNFVAHRSGHLYFSLKDERGVIRAAMFRSSAQGLRFRPVDGMRVIAYGSVSLYPASGSYQLYVTHMERFGVGDLYLAYEELKKRLGAEGLFAPERKKPIPRYPREIGVITSPTGAAVRDILRILGRRFPLASVILYPASVQGEGAAESILGGVEYFNIDRPVDTIILGRGGGSIEDLWAFNDENLARAIAASEIPIISAVGHETDFTIADFVSDLRAPTPSAAAELAVPDASELLRSLAALPERLLSRISDRLASAAARLRAVTERPVLLRPEAALREKTLRLAGLCDRTDAAMSARLAASSAELARRAAKLEALSPLATLARGYSVVQTDSGMLVRSASQVSVGDHLRLSLSDGELLASVTEVDTKGE
jgi:exodeoxyribonuclease VII large subunit